MGRWGNGELFSPPIVPSSSLQTRTVLRLPRLFRHTNFTFADRQNFFKSTFTFFSTVFFMFSFLLFFLLFFVDSRFSKTCKFSGKCVR